jgi:hypothetical protein
MTDSDDVGSVSVSVWGILDRDALAAEIVLEIVDELQLLLDREPTDDRLKHRANSDMMFADKAAVVDVDKHAHQKSASEGSFRCQNIVISHEKWSSTYWQSIRSVIPPCPGILSPKSLMLKARLKPEAKKPPNGATNDAKHAINKRWS